MQPKSLMMMPWYPRDFAASTRGWPFMARAAYRELLDVQWDMGEIPSDANLVRNLLQIRARDWPNVWRLVAPKFPLNGSGRKNIRLEEHRVKAQALYAQRALGAQLANAQRYGQRSHPNPYPKPYINPKSEDALKSAPLEKERSKEGLASANKALADLYESTHGRLGRPLSNAKPS